MKKKKHFVENKTIKHYVLKCSKLSTLPNIQNELLGVFSYMHSHGWDSKHSVIRCLTANKTKPLNSFTFIAGCSTHLQMSELKQEPTLWAIPTFHM